MKAYIQVAYDIGIISGKVYILRGEIYGKVYI